MTIQKKFDCFLFVAVIKKNFKTLRFFLFRFQDSIFPSNFFSFILLFYCFPRKMIFPFSLSPFLIFFTNLLKIPHLFSSSIKAFASISLNSDHNIFCQINPHSTPFLLNLPNYNTKLASLLNQSLILLFRIHSYSFISCLPPLLLLFLKSFLN